MIFVFVLIVYSMSVTKTNQSLKSILLNQTDFKEFDFFATHKTILAKTRVENLDNMTK